MKPPSARLQQKVGSESVSGDLPQKPFKQKPDSEIDSYIDLEIERSLYFLGRALYRFSLLQQERSKND